MLSFLTEEIIDFLNEKDIEFSLNADLSRLSSIGIGGRCALLAEPKSEEQFIETVNFLTDTKIKFKVLGNLSNVLISDNGFNGVVVKTTKLSCYSLAETILTVSCGTLISPLIKEISKFGICGFENLYGIPGTLGGMLYSNAGAFGGEISDRLISASFYSPSSKRIETLEKSEMRLGYRNSILKDSDMLLLSAEFSAERANAEIIKDRLSSVIQKRKATQPYGKKSLGSVFKHNGEIAPALLIDRLGLKGKTVGGAQISEKHAGFIINTGGATFQDFFNLKEHVKKRLFDAYGILFEEEIEILI